jgi:FkbM family methyltransferase
MYIANNTNLQSDRKLEIVEILDALSQYESRYPLSYLLSPEWTSYRKKFLSYCRSLLKKESGSRLQNIIFHPPCLPGSEIIQDSNLASSTVKRQAWCLRAVSEWQPKEVLDLSEDRAFSMVISQISWTDRVTPSPLPDARLPFGLREHYGGVYSLPYQDSSKSWVVAIDTLSKVGLIEQYGQVSANAAWEVAKEIERVMQEGGHLLISIYLGNPSVLFDRYQIFSVDSLLQHFPGYLTIDELYLDSLGNPVHAQNLSSFQAGEYLLYCAHLIKAPKVNSVYQGYTIRETEKNFLKKFVRSGDLVFDVGANRGYKTEAYLSCGAKVVCFEPHPGCVSVLMQRYGFMDEVTIVNKGLAREPGKLILNICSSESQIATFANEWKTGRFGNFYDFTWDQQVVVDTMTLDSAIDFYGVPRFCKIDVEGFESDVLRGLSSPIPYISFEFLKEFPDNIAECLRHLSSLGYSKFNVSIGSYPIMRFQEWVDMETITNFINHGHNFLGGDLYAVFD